MKIIAQAAIGVSQFLHPDYLSAANYNVINFSDGWISTLEIYLILYSLTGIILLGILIKHLIDVRRKRNKAD